MMNRTTLASASALLAIVAGCTIVEVGPDYERHEFDIPESAMPDAGLPTTNRTDIGEFKPAEGEEDVRAVMTPSDMDCWWKNFDDPVLSGLVEMSVTNSVSYRMALERLEASRWELAGALSPFFPSLAGSGSFARSEFGRHTPSGEGAGRKLHSDAYSLGLGMSWDLDIFGGNMRSLEYYIAKVQSAAYNTEDAWVTLTTEVASQYISLRTTQQRIEVARTNLVLQTETYDILKSRLDSGIGDELAVNQSRYVVDQTHATIPKLLAQEEALKNSIGILVGLMPGSLHDQLAECPRRDWQIEPARLDGTPVNLIRRRPDVRAAERDLAAQTARIGVAKSQWFPKLSITGTLGLQSQKGKHLLEHGALYGSLGPSVSWPIFQGGRIYSSVKAEENRTREACLSYELAVQNAYSEVRNAYAAYTQEQHRYEALKSAVQAAQDAVAIANDLYKNGLRDFTAVIDAQRSLLTLSESLVVSRGDITQDLITLCRALGGGIGQNGPEASGEGAGEQEPAEAESK